MTIFIIFLCMNIMYIVFLTTIDDLLLNHTIANTFSNIINKIKSKLGGKNSMIKKNKLHICKVCKTNFELLKENKYIACDNKGVQTIATGYKYYECFDCPKCGCQNIVNIREKEVDKK